MTTPSVATSPAHALPHVQLFSPEAVTQPRATLRRLRAESPVSWSPELHAFLLTRYADILAVLKDRRMAVTNMTGSLARLSAEEQDELLPLRRSVSLWMGHTNTQDHLRFQGLLKRYFTPTTVEALRPRVRQFTEELLDAAEARGSMEVVSELAYPLPVNVIAEMLGIPLHGREKLQEWSRDITAVFVPSDIHQLRRSQRSILEMQDYMRPLVAERRREPREDLLSVLLAAEKDGNVTEAEIVSNCVLLLFAGHETTATLISNGLTLLFENPEQLAALRAQPELLPTAVEEMLRCDGPAHLITRVSAEPVEIGGHAFPAGQMFFLSLATANRDPDVYPEPDRFDITRKPNRHLAFGMGSFYCLGAALARLEAEECFRLLLARFPNLRPVDPTPDWQPVAPLGHSLKSLRVAF